MRYGSYRPLAQLGAGRDGLRFRADDPATGELVDLLVLGPARADESRWNWLARRLRAARLLDHPTARRVVALDLEAAPPFVALGWLDAPTLADLGATGGIGPTTGIAILRGLAEGLAAGHKLGLAHGRVGPGAIRMVDGREPRLDWTGVEAGAAGEGEPVGGRASVVADLRDFGSLVRWMNEHGVSEGPGDLLDGLASRLLADDSTERPSARELATALQAIGWDEADGLTLPSTSSMIETGELMFDLGRSSPSPSPRPKAERAGIGRFRIVGTLGQGGMGSVYLAIDPIDGREVAVKLLNPSWSERPDALRRFLKEARLLAEVESPHVANFLEVNEDDGVHYLVLEYVKGTNLAERMARAGPSDEPTALAILADVARALTVAHGRGIVHRDVKPENILLVDGPGPTRVKLSDFGLARHLDQTDSLAMTQAGAILGTPLYMAPEQCMGEAVDPRTDVYAAGATLFHLLAGRPPFVGPTALAVIGGHRNDPPPPLKSLRPDVSDGTAQVVAKCLAKSPADRYDDASALLVDLERLIRGEPTGIEVHPIMPPHDPGDVLRFDWRYDLEAGPRELWPHVANTERLNKAAGMPPVDFRSEPNAGGGVHRFGRLKTLGMALAWQEHPYEWVEGRRLGVLREYAEGPIRWLANLVELEPRPGGGTLLTQRIVILPRNLLARTATAVQIGIRGKKSFQAVYQRIDAAVTGRLGRGGAADPFQAPGPLDPARQARLDRWLDSLGARGLDATLIGRLGDFLAQAPSQEIARIRPLALAARLKVDPRELIDACLLGAKDGLLILLWDLLCPICRIPSRIIDTLRDLREHDHCPACRADFPVDFANSVELIFRVHPEVRPSDLGVYCIGGPIHSPHVAAQARVGPGERLVLEMALDPGSYRFRGPQLPYAIDFRVAPEAGESRWDLVLGRPPADDLPRSLRAGRQAFSLTNETDRELTIRVERLATRSDAMTAGRASTSALFRELFPGEILEPGQLVTLETATFLVTRLAGAGRLYETLGDAKTFAILHDHFRRVEAVIRREGGALVKTVEEGVYAAFADSTAAVRAAMALPAMTSVAGFDDADVRFQVGLHRGPAMVATINDQIDYFGATVRVAVALPALAVAGGVVATEDLVAEPGVSALLRSLGLRGEVIPSEVPGLAGRLVVRLRPDPVPEACPAAPLPALAGLLNVGNYAP